MVAFSVSFSFSFKLYDGCGSFFFFKSALSLCSAFSVICDMVSCNNGPLPIATHFLARFTHLLLQERAPVSLKEAEGPRTQFFFYFARAVVLF